MPLIDGILETALYVDDLQRSAEFYRDVLDLAVIDSGERLQALAVGSRQVLLLFRKGASTALPRTAHDGDGRLHVAFAISARELPAWEARLQERGIGVVERKVWSRGGISLYFRDPDGHLVELATPGVWSVY